MADCSRCGAPAKPVARFCSRCGARLATTAGDWAGVASGAVLQGGRYQVIGQLGQGGMGAVYLARDMELFQRLCVVKQMRPFFASASERRKAEEDFQREAEVLARLSQPGHPRIPEVYGYFVEQGDQFLVMKYIEGESLEHRLQRLKRPLPEVEVIRCAVEVADALVYLHNRQPQPVVHRDIKPANILIDAENRVWLVDFGLARAVVGGGGRVIVAGGRTVAAGTPGYTPLEQWQMQATPKSDIFALGATLHHLLTARDPRERFSSYDELDLQILRSLAGFQPLAEARPDLRSGLAALVSRCLDPDPRMRPAAGELKAALIRLAPGGGRVAEAFRRLSPSIGEMIGAAVASFVRSLFGAPAAARAQPPPGQPSAPAAHDGARLAVGCALCGGRGTRKDGRPCLLCGGSGTIWREK